jgi:tryptophanyl-tRNA synthetase
LAGGKHTKRVLSGMRPTGRLHIGNYFGALANWVKLQNDAAYECFYFIADWHSLTSDYADTSQIAQNTVEVAIDYLASGLDPEKSTIFLQSLVPEHAELQLLLSMVAPLKWLERIPTYKEALENIQGKDLHTYGFLGYPVLQTGDIVMYGELGRELLVPVGEDQVSHVEFGRELVRRFNEYMGVRIDRALLAEGNRGQLRELLRVLEVRFELAELNRLQPSVGGLISDLEASLLSRLRRVIGERGVENVLGLLSSSAKFVGYEQVLCEAQALLTPTPRIPGTDGRKMSKSYGNAIFLSESDERIWEKVRPMMTDPARKRRSDPGNPEVCPVYDWHKLFSPPETLAWSAEGCRSAAIGCLECKRAMADNLTKWIAPVRARRQQYQSHPRLALEVLQEGSRRARQTAAKTMERVREAVLGWEKTQNSLAGGMHPEG